MTQSPLLTVARSPSLSVLITNCPLGCPAGSVMVALLPKLPSTVGIGAASLTGAGTVGAALDADGDTSAGAFEPLLQATSSSMGRATSKPAVRRTVFLTVGRGRLFGLLRQRKPRPHRAPVGDTGARTYVTPLSRASHVTCPR